VNTLTLEQSRAESLASRIASLDGNPARREAVALGLVDAVLNADTPTLTRALEALRDARARTHGDEHLTGWLDAALALAYWGVERLPTPSAVTAGTQDHAFLRALDGSAHRASADLRRVLEVDDTQVSRAGRRLLQRGLVARRKVGREAYWLLTPRGRHALQQSSAPTPAVNASFWQDALRRGFEAAYDGKPRKPRTVDPTRERIITKTLELHAMVGIQATTTAQIAERAVVPVDTVDRLFPTQDELVRSCAEHVMESLRLPPADRAPDVFTGAVSASQRIRRLVETFFDVYERLGAGISAGRRESKDLPVVRQSMEAVEGSLDALVVEALRPLEPHAAAVASVRALTDLELWRTLRSHGASSQDAVQHATSTIERWLEAQPTR